VIERKRKAGEDVVAAPAAAGAAEAGEDGDAGDGAEVIDLMEVIKRNLGGRTASTRAAKPARRAAR
jgi:hypothetical protein